MQKFYWSNQQGSFSDKCRNLKHVSCPDHFVDNKRELYQDFTTLTLSINNPQQIQTCCSSPATAGRTQTRIDQDRVCSVQVKTAESPEDRGERPWDDYVVNTHNKVVLKLGDVASDNTEIITREPLRASTPAVTHRQYNRTWNENTKSQYNELLRDRQRKSIQNTTIFHHDYENVYDDNDSTVKDKKCPSSSARNTPRSRKKKKQHQAGSGGGGAVYRSRSCERLTRDTGGGPGVLDRLSDSLSPPSTPTPSLLQSVAARAIPCVDIKVARVARQ